MPHQPDLTKHYARFRLQSPKKFKSGSFRTIKAGSHGSKLIIGRPKHKSTTQAQSLLVPRKRYEHAYKQETKEHPEIPAKTRKAIVRDHFLSPTQRKRIKML